MKGALRAWSGLICLILVVSMGLGATLAWKSLNQTARNDVRHERERVPVELIKLEKLKNAKGEELPTGKAVAGAEFNLFTEEAKKQLGGAYTTDADGRINLELKPGNYYFEETYPGLGYDYDLLDSKPVTQYHFSVDGTKEKVTVTVYDRRLTGSLTVTKTVKNHDGRELTEAQRNQEFNFTVTFSDGGSYLCAVDGQSPQLLPAGGGAFKLRHGQRAVFPTLPVGVRYTVMEVPVADYSVSSTGSSGNITQEGQTAEFTNVFGQPPVEHPVLVVKKEVAGECPPGDAGKRFQFELTVNGGTAIPFTLAAGESKEFPDLSFGDVYSIVETDVFPEGYTTTCVNAAGTIALEQTEAVFTNTYRGRIMTEVSGRKTWTVDEAHRGLIPASVPIRIYDEKGRLVQEKEVSRNEAGEWRYSFTVPKYDEQGHEIAYRVEEGPVDNFAPHYRGTDIENVYVPEVIDIDPPITIEKVVDGAGAPVKEFKFILQSQDEAPLPGGAKGERLEYTLRAGGSVELGIFSFKRPGTYVYTVYEESGSGANWTYDPGRYTLTFKVEEENGKLRVERSIVRDGLSAVSLIFINRYSSGGGGSGGGGGGDDDSGSVKISGTKHWIHGENPAGKWPDSVVVCVYANGELAHRQRVTEKDGWKYTVTLPKRDRRGQKITYTVGEEPVPGYEVEVRGYDLVNTYVGEAVPTPTPTESAAPVPTESIPPTETPSPGETPVPGESQVPTPTSEPGATPPPDVAKTGDNGELNLWLAVTISGGLGMLACVVFLFRRKHRYVGKRLLKK